MVQVEDCRAVDDAKRGIGRKRTEQNIHGSNLGQQVRLLLWDHRAINGWPDSVLAWGPFSLFLNPILKVTIWKKYKQLVFLKPNFLKPKCQVGNLRILRHWRLLDLDRSPERRGWGGHEACPGKWEAAHSPASSWSFSSASGDRPLWNLLSSCVHSETSQVSSLGL